MAKHTSLQQRLDAAGKMILIDGDDKYDCDAVDISFFLKSKNGTHSPPSRTDFLNLRDCSCRQNAVGMFAMKASPIVAYRNMLG